MSLADEIKARVRELDRKELHFFEVRVDADDERWLILTNDVHSAIQTPFPDGRADRHAELLDTFDLWAENGIFTVSEKPDDHPRHTMLARTAPIAAEIWDMRCVDVDHGIRVLGAFAGKNIFVALLWEYREDIVDFDAWVIEGRKEWDRLFFPLPPFSGVSVNEYLSGYHVLKETRRRRADTR